MPLSNPFRRAADRPTLRERAVVRLREPAAPVEVESTPEPPLVPQEAPPTDSDPIPEETVAPEPEPVAEAIILPWRGAGNVVSAAGCAVLALVGRRA